MLSKNHEPKTPQISELEIATLLIVFIQVMLYFSFISFSRGDELLQSTKPLIFVVGFGIMLLYVIFPKKQLDVSQKIGFIAIYNTSILFLNGIVSAIFIGASIFITFDLLNIYSIHLLDVLGDSTIENLIWALVYAVTSGQYVAKYRKLQEKTISSFTFEKADQMISNAQIKTKGIVLVILISGILLAGLYLDHRPIIWTIAGVLVIFDLTLSFLHRLPRSMLMEEYM